MPDDFNDLRTSLKRSTEAFRPELDASALEETSRARSRRRTIIGGVSATLAVALAAVIVVPYAVVQRATVPAAPAPLGASPFESAPTLGPTPSDGNTVKRFDSMTMPVPGAVAPDASWSRAIAASANLQAQYPPDWIMLEGRWGVISIMAPSGYTIDLRTDTQQESCDDGAATTARQIATTDLVAITSLGKGAVAIRWRDGGKSPVSINLAQHSATKPCWQKFLNYGGVDDAYLGSADNSANPTVTELDQAVAILASASRVH